MADDRLSNLQKFKDAQQEVTVEFKEIVDIQLLKNMTGITAVSINRSSTFNIICADAEAVKKQLLQLSIDKNLNIISLKSREQSLENIFRELTQ